MGDVGIAVNRYLGLFAVEAVELIANPGVRGGTGAAATMRWP